MQQTGVQNVKVSSDAAQMVNGRTRLKGFILSGGSTSSTFGNVKFYNGTGTGDPLGLEVNLGPWSIYQGNTLVNIPGNGILFDSGIYLVKTASVVLCVSIIFQGGAAD